MIRPIALRFTTISHTYQICAIYAYASYMPLLPFTNYTIFKTVFVSTSFTSYTVKIPAYQGTMFQLNENTLLGTPPVFRRRSSTLNPQSNRMKNKTKSCSDLLDLPGIPTAQDAPTWSPVPDVLKSSSQTTALDLPMRTKDTKVSSGRILCHKYTHRH